MKVYLLYKAVDDYRCYEGQEHYTEVWGVFLDKSIADKECEALNLKYKVKEKGLSIFYYVKEAETDKVYNVDD